MRLVELTLENIRSYERLHVRFPEGIVLISGDIGAGKSTMLLAIEFALFGLGRGELAGSQLLRHGAREASVTLTLALPTGEITIHRTLRTSATGIVQAAGWLEHEGRREQLTPSELRARIFILLGYPLLFLNRKNLLYRSTIYTPQEEMKQLLLLAPQERLEAIRRIFGVDAYKTVRENAQLLARTYKEEERAAAQLIERIEHELEQLHTRLGEREQIHAQRTVLLAERARLAATLAQVEKRLEQEEALQRSLAQQQAQIALRERARQLARQELGRMQQRREEVIARNAQVTSVLERIDKRLAELPEPPTDLDAQLTQERAALEVLSIEEGSLRAQEQRASHAIGIGEGEHCPTCEQLVTGTHLQTIAHAHARERERIAQQRAELAIRQRASRAHLTILEQALHGRQERTALLERKHEQQALREQLGTEVQQLTELIAAQSSQLAQLGVEQPAQELGLRAQVAQETLARTRAELARLRAEHVALERRDAASAQQLTHLDEIERSAAERATELARQRAVRASVSATHAWLLERFTPTTELIEQRILRSVHSVFAAKLSQLFLQLVGDESMTLALDSQFTALIAQDGYEVEYSTLSGGERSALALAYRLALVHTMHQLMGELATAGLLIFDEPTDGFSIEQLARLQEVLRTLGMEQILLVSHEVELEGCADVIVRVEKGAGGSRVDA